MAIRVDGKEVTFPFTLILPNIDNNNSFVSIKKDENRCVLSYQNKEGEGIGQWIEWDHEQIIPVYRDMVLKGPFLVTYPFNFIKWPVLVNTEGRIFLIIR